MVVAGSRAKLIERANNHRDDERARGAGSRRIVLRWGARVVTRSEV